MGRKEIRHYHDYINWLESHGRSAVDVLLNGDGDPIIYVEVENGNPGEPGYEVVIDELLIPNRFLDLF